MDCWQKIRYFSCAEGCVDIRPRTVVAFFGGWQGREYAVKYDTQNMAESIELQCEDGSAKCSSIICLMIYPPWLSLFPFAGTLTGQTLNLPDWIFMSLVFSHILSISVSFCCTFCEVSTLNALLSCWNFLFILAIIFSVAKNLFIGCSFFNNNLFFLL